MLRRHFGLRAIERLHYMLLVETLRHTDRIQRQ